MKLLKTKLADGELIEGTDESFYAVTWFAKEYRKSGYQTTVSISYVDWLLRGVKKYYFMAWDSMGMCS